MKKTVLIVSVIALALLVVGAVGVGVAYAQSGQPPVYGRGMMGGGGYGPMHDYVERTLADKLGLTGADADAYAKSVVQADFAEAGDEDVFRKIRADFDAKKVDQTDHQIRRTMDEMRALAFEQLRGEAR